ncbi:RNA-directed DNA polymerase, eukaryota, reverse transcriptase zinc-binding domain protein, partial [Tanacetum coccineum]
MRTKRNLKVPLNLKGFVHSINTNSTISKKRVSKKNDSSAMNQKLCKNGKGDKGGNNGNIKKGEYRNETKDQYWEQHENEGFMGDLNGEQFPPIKDKANMNGKLNSPCLDKNAASARIDEWEGKNLVDIVNASKLDNKLLEIPTKVNENGSEVLIFDDELIDLGSKKWNLTFQDEEGIKEVINNGLWMVNNKPMFVQKWCIDMCLATLNQRSYLYGVKMLKIPMEAWSVKGISVLASSLGKPIIKYEVTTRMCVTGVGRIGFARVLIEIDAEKEIKDIIEIIYKEKNVTEGTKTLWMLNMLGNLLYVHIAKLLDMKRLVQNRRIRNVGFEQNRNHQGQNVYTGRQCNVGRNPRENPKKPNAGKYEYRKRMEEITNVKGLGVNNKEPQKDVGNNTEKENNDVQNKTNTKESKNYKNGPKEGELKGISKSNRFTLLNELVDEDELVPSLNEREIVDSFVNNRIHPTEKDMEKWNSFMIRYYKDRKEIIDVMGDMDDMDSKDVVKEVNGTEKSCLRDEVDGEGGLSTSEKQKEVQKLISEEKIQLMAVLETHIKYKNVKNSCDNIFGNWDYCTNSVNDNKGCRTMIGWDTNSVNVWVIDQSKQYMFLLVESLNRKTKFFYTMVYASNSGGERKDLWKSLKDHKHIVNGNPWAVSGNFNVTLAVNEHSSGSSFSSNDMKEFHECINDVELENVNNLGFFFNWTKSLKNPDCRTLKKLDRIMVNEDLISKYL